MNAIKTALATLLVGTVLCSCKKSEAKLDTPEKFVAEYKACHAKGINDIMGLFYKKDQIPENMLKLMEESEKAFIGLKIKSVTTEPFDATDYDKGVEAMKGMNMKMPVKPTHNIKIVYENKAGAAESTMPIAKIDGSFYLISPLKAQ
jgi:hypothetical protein